MAINGRSHDVMRKPPFKTSLLNVFSICSGGGKGIVATPLEIVKVYPLNRGF
jgi:hypothetical protein